MFVSREPFLKKEYNIREDNRGRDNMQRCSTFHANSAVNQSNDTRVKYTQEVQEWPF
jgi:hypothetical protein